ncbi:XdhC family protein [Rhizosaccharibacter radicis]|uniref:XdhC family protein n=1 Tax=Rhizosaccharibacter radicis TaxID=2782605 RepID=A0ABT1W1A7_9PROT|nr:XdhC family protein [Acetobacteraceae bacterium KSS12]
MTALDPAPPPADPLLLAADWQRAGLGVALATVTETWGSSPRPAGSLMVVATDGRIAGSVSGGCVESAVAEAALQALQDRRPRLLGFGITDEDAWSVGLACGGSIKVLVQPIATGPAGAVGVA